MKYVKSKWFLAVLAIIIIACQRDEKDFIKPIPLALDASEISSSGFTANWKSMLGARDYTIELSHSESFDSLLEEFPQVTTDTSYKVASLEASHIYYYRIKASKYNGPTDYSKKVKVLTEGLTIPVVLDASEVTSTSFKAQWRKVANVSSYLLYVAKDVNFTNLLNGFNGKEVNDTLYTIKDLEINQNYFYKVKAKREASISSFSATVLTSTSDLSPPALSESTNIHYTGFTINWQPVQDAMSYLIFVSKDPLMATTLPEYTAKEVSALSMEVKSLDANTAYYYRVQAKNEVTLSGKSDISYVKTTALESPVSLSAQNVKTNSFQARWKPVSGADNYQVDVASDVNFEQLLPDYHGVVTTDTSLLVDGLTLNETYFYRVSAVKDDDMSAYSNIISQTTTSLVKPVLLTPSNITINSFIANWELVPEAASYEFDLSVDPLFSTVFPTYDALYVESNSVTVTGLDAGKTYYYRVRATDGVVTTENSKTEMVKTTPIAAPTVESATNIKVSSFQANWEAVTGVDSYLLDVAYDANFENILPNYFEKEIYGTNDIIGNLEPSTTYFYRVRSKKENSFSDYSGSVSAVTLPLPPPAIDTSKSNNRKAFEFEAHWESIAEASSYLLYIAEDEAFTNMLTGYNGKEIVGNSWYVSNVDPYKTYYYRVKSKKYQKLSEHSITATVNKVITSTCRLSTREFEGVQREKYTYNADDLLSIVRLYDLTNNDLLVRESTITYTANNDIDSITVKYDDFGSLKLYASYKCFYEGGRITVVDVSDQNGVFVERWRLVFADDRITEFKKFSDRVETVLKYRETYYYNNQGQVIEVRDANNSAIRKFMYNQDFNAEYLIPHDLQMLLEDMSGSTENLFSFMHDLSYYQYLEGGVWRNFSYVYEYNDSGMPTRLLGHGDIPDLIYKYDENCDF